MTVKAILVAGGHGSRLRPFTRYTQKTLLPLHERPVIDYALGTIRRAGIKDITIISNQFVGQIARHVGQGLPGERIHYVIEEEPQGVAHALNLARPYNEGSRLMVYFSDNITTLEFGEHVAAFEAAEQPPGCLLIAREEPHPEAFGVAVFDRTANHACSNDAYFHLARSSYRWGVGSNLPSFAICEAWRRESGVPQSTHVSSPTESTEARPALT